MQGGRDRLGDARAEARQLRRSPAPRPRELAHRAEVPQQRSPPGRAEAGHAVQLAGRQRRRPLLPVVGDREPVRLVPDPLQQVQALAGARQDHRAVLAGQPDLLQPLGQPAHRHVVDAELVQRPRRRGHLGRPAVDDHQVGRVGELAPRLARSSGRPAVRVAEHVELAGRLALLQVAAEPAGDHLVDRGDVVGAVQAADANLRYSDLRARPSSNTTMDATTWVPCRFDTS